MLADLLWSERAEEQARASLRQELSVLRKMLPEGVLDADRQLVRLDPSRVAVDRSGFGDFLEGFDLASERFEDWLRQERSAQGEQARERSIPELPARETRPGLAVLPFEAFGADDRDMFADGVVEDITSALSRVRGFHVIARQSAFALKGERLDIPAAGARLGVNYVVEGSVRRSGDRVRIAVQLVAARDGRTLWAERFDDRLDDLFDLQDRIAAKVAGQVAPHLRAAEIARANRRVPEERSAYEMTLTALPHFWSHRREETLKAIGYLDQALAHSPDYLPALAYKSWCHAHQCCYLWSADGHSDRDTALSLLARARPLVQDDAAVLVALGAVCSIAGNDFEQAEAFVNRALQLDPNNAWGWLRKGWNGLYRGRFQEALDAFDRCEQLSPLDPFHFNVLFGRSAVMRSLNRFDESIALVYEGLRAGPGVTWAYRMLFATLWMAGRKDEALEAGRLWRSTNPGLTPELMSTLLPKWTHDPEYLVALKQLWELED
ncbi:hypothetical protein M4578_16350 [Salipiger sp. P9]|uniref:hypothetical protein n=1 Tax=Salipiger pentaromativorans TaxID=2943193 RepID=UPI0021582E12|nr:hypothetical protein [Salipiger pentaromativorans]MCR8549404.1 hypothetical protein [Salipiger pentaromativorans]